MEENKIIKKISPTKAIKATSKKVTEKAPVKKVAVKTEKIETSIKTDTVMGALKISVMDTTGKATGTMVLPEAIFGAKINTTLMAQAVRVYLANQRQGNASTKTRGEVTGSTRKIYRQKGTGRARHGGIRAPIFVKGGVAHGPKPKDYSLSMPVKMKRAALFSALTAQLQHGNIIVVEGLQNVGPKTKNMALVLMAMGLKKKSLIVMPSLLADVYKAGRNIAGVTLSPASQLSTYAVLGAGKIVLMKESVEAVEKSFVSIGKSQDSK